MNLKKGDQVKIMAGKDRGKTGAILKVWNDLGRVSVEGVNTYKKRMRPNQKQKKGETVSVVRPLAASNVMLVCKNCKKVTRVGFRIDGGKKVRFCKKCEAAV